MAIDGKPSAMSMLAKQRSLAVVLGTAFSHATARIKSTNKFVARYEEHY
jgi:hypothetical protein